MAFATMIFVQCFYVCLRLCLSICTNKRVFINFLIRMCEPLQSIFVFSKMPAQKHSDGAWVLQLDDWWGITIQKEPLRIRWFCWPVHRANTATRPQSRAAGKGSGPLRTLLIFVHLKVMYPFFSTQPLTWDSQLAGSHLMIQECQRLEAALSPYDAGIVSEHLFGSKEPIWWFKIWWSMSGVTQISMNVNELKSEATSFEGDPATGWCWSSNLIYSKAFDINHIVQNVQWYDFNHVLQHASPIESSVK